MAGFEDLADEAREQRDDEMPGTRSPANEVIGADGTGSDETSTDPHVPTADTDATGGAWAAADHAGSEEGSDGFGPEGTRSAATDARTTGMGEAGDADIDASGFGDPFDGGAVDARGD
ncbi:hypothetical protein [Agrococcus sp. HG114]|uniref:hypothetical protein n=1 Tax=Agrococcus sp. HG114 TaxID=2969757 RepID=UPI00215A3932|nr:hypothetical protein [Agrococcus sp. HG114]MCR8671535.1 hypothetical protein [Agrococcus sp. HG114]